MDASGRTNRYKWLINGLLQAVIDSGLSNVLIEGYPFTWFKSLGTPRVVQEMLEKTLAKNAWFDIFPSGKLENLAASASDHCPILLIHCPVVRPPPADCNFRFENAWKLEPGFNYMMKESWLSYNDQPVFNQYSFNS
jgi:hypothetical protein